MSDDAVRIVVEDTDGPILPPRLPRWVLLAVIVSLVGGAVTWAAASQDSPSSNVVSIATTTTAVSPLDVATTTATAAPVTSTTDSAISGGPPTSTPQGSVEFMVALLDGASALQGDVVLATQPGAFGGGSLWVFGTDGSVVHRNDVPLWPGDYPYPILMTGGRIAFANPTDGFLIDAGLAEPPEPLLTEASFVIPGATPGLIWFVGGGVEWVAPVDVESQTVGERIDVTEVFIWPVAGVADGLIVIPIDEGSYGRYAYWSPSGGLQRLDLRDPQHEDVLAASGNVAIVESPNEVSMLNIVSGNYLAAFGIEFARSVLSSVCLSPDQQHLAMIGSGGEAFLGDVDDGSFIELPSGIYGWRSIGWTSDTQLVYIIDIEDETFVQTLDITTGETQDIATLQSFRGWTLSASGSMC